MKIKQFSCPNCDSQLDPNMIEDNTSIYCPYCGYYFTVENENHTQTSNKNINKTVTINKNIHNQITNDAEVIRANTERKKHSSGNAWAVFWIIVVIGLVVFGVVKLKEYDADQKARMAEQEEAIEKAERAGKIQVQYDSYTFKDENYKTVKAKLEDAGFTNIETVDLEDSGLAFWNYGNVEFVSIDGKKNFSSDNYYMPDVKIVIYHH